MAIYFTSDWHIGHYNILRYCNRPFPSVTDMEIAMLDGLQVIKPEDDLYVVGDCAMSGGRKYLADFLKCFKGRKHLIKGNHDDRRTTKQFLEAGFSTVQGHIHMRHEMWNVDFLVAHDPVASIVAPDMVTICGHVHQLWLTLGRCINVGVDMWEFKPVHIDQLLPLVERVSPLPVHDISETPDAERRKLLAQRYAKLGKIIDIN